MYNFLSGTKVAHASSSQNKNHMSQHKEIIKITLGNDTQFHFRSQYELDY